MTALLTPAIVDQSARMPGGVLSRSLPAPAGWERGGLIIPFYGCGEPVLRDKCVEATDVPHRGGVAEFPAFPIEQGVTCSTTGPDSLIQRAADRYGATSDWSLGRQLQTDQAATGAPKLEDATTMGTVADGQFISAVACLEQAAADAGFGAKIVLHAPVRAAAYLASQGLLDTNGLSPTGSPWIISSGYEAQSVSLVRLYATGTVWAAVTQPEISENVSYATNDIDAWARGVGVVAFDDCVLVSIDVEVGECP